LIGAAVLGNAGSERHCQGEKHVEGMCFWPVALMAIALSVALSVLIAMGFGIIAYGVSLFLCLRSVRVP
jgi:hypothetical protein